MTLLNSLLSLVIFWRHLQGSLHTVSCHLQIMRVFFFFSNLDSFYFSSLTAMAINSKTMLNNSGKSGHLCLLPDLRGNALSFSVLSIMLAVDLSYVSFIMFHWDIFHLRIFIKNGCGILSKAFSASIEIIIINGYYSSIC